MKKVFLVVVLLLVVAVCAGAVWIKYSQAAAEKASAAAGLVKVERGDLRMLVSATGKVVSNLDVDIKCRASGIVLKLPFDISESVKEGDLLVQLDTTDEVHAVDIAQANLDSANAKLEEARLAYDIAQKDLVTSTQKANAALESAKAKQADLTAKATRMKHLLDDKLVSQEDYETAQTAADQAVADVHTAEAAVSDLKSQAVGVDVKKQDIKLSQASVDSYSVSLANAKQQLAYTTVTAPISGVISARTIQIGNVMQSAISNVSGGSAVMTISDLSHIYVLASVDESDIGSVVKGMPVEITADAFPGKHFAGKVVRIATTGVNASNVVTFEVKIEVTGAEKALLKPQMTANIDIVIAERKGVLNAPVTAISHKQDKAFVNYVKADGGVEQREVTPGISDGSATEIVSGLAEGDQVQINKGVIESRWNGQPDKDKRKGGG